jgi:hypothetical protein
MLATANRDHRGSVSPTCGFAQKKKTPVGRLRLLTILAFGGDFLFMDACFANPRRDRPRWKWLALTVWFRRIGLLRKIDAVIGFPLSMIGLPDFIARTIRR